MCWKTCKDTCKKKNETGQLFYTIYKNKLKWIKDLNVISETIKLLEKENIGSKYFDVTLNSIFFLFVSLGMATKAKVNKWDYVKLKSLFTVKETINKMKNLTKWEKILVIIYLIGVNRHNIWRTHLLNIKKKQSKRKLGIGPGQIFI